MLRRVVGFAGRVVLGLAALAFVLGATLFLLGLHLTLVPLRVRQHAQVRLVLELAAGMAALAQLSRKPAADDEVGGDGEPTGGPS